jgi:GNAT superfamily N-acetyltransferase
MSIVHPSPAKLEALRARWEGQEGRLRTIAAAMLAGEDWTTHLRGLPHIDEIPPRPGEAYGRDLRGADLKRCLAPEALIAPAHEGEAALVAGLVFEAERTSTPLAGVSPFPTDLDCAERTTLAMRRGEVFLLARVLGRAVGSVRVARRSEFRDLAADGEYAEVSDLAVLPSHRRQGIGRRLIQAAEAWARVQGLDHVLLRTYEELGLVTWYLGMGFCVQRVRQIVPVEGPAALEVICTQRLQPGQSATQGVPTTQEGQRIRA